MADRPPVPPENRSPKGTGDPKGVQPDRNSRPERRPENPDEQGQQGNIKQNTTHQGYQQDR
jgi:hypothetical protein